MDLARWAGCIAGFKFSEHKPMNPLSTRSLLLAFALLTPFLQAQDAAARIREIEQKVLLKQQQEAVSALIGAAGETTNPEIIGKRVQWLTLVNNRIEGDDQMAAASREEMASSAETLNALAWRMIVSPDAGACNPEIALKLVTIALELVGGNKDLTPGMLDTKARALFMLGNQREAIVQQEKAVAASSVEEQKTMFESTLAAYRRNELPRISPPSQGEEEPLVGFNYITAKLNRIVLSKVDFEDTPMDEVVELLRKQSIDLDAAEPDPARKGVNFVVQRAVAKPVAEADGDSQTPAVEPDTLRVKGLHLRNVPLAIVLKYICDNTGSRLKVDDYAVTFIPLNMPEGLFSRTFRMPKDFPSMLDSGSDTDKTPGDPKARPALIELLKSNGINFGEGASLTFIVPDMLVVTNTPTELDKLEMLIGAASQGGQ